MPCVRIKGGIICGNHPVHEYKGFFFEFHPYCGPMEVDKDGEPVKESTMAFWRAVTEWAQKEKSNVYP